MRMPPRTLKFYSFLMLSLALSIPAQAWFLYEVPIYDLAGWAKHITWLNWLVFGALLTCSVLSYRASKNLFYAAPVAVILVALNNYWVGYVGLDYSALQTMLATVGFAAVNIILLESDVRAVLSNRKVQWWRASERRRIQLPISVHPWVGTTLVSMTHDLSATGAYISCENELDYKVGDQMQLRMNIDGYKDIRCTARLVRKSSGSGTYPAGFGIEFQELSRHQRQFLNNLLSTSLS